MKIKTKFLTHKKQKEQKLEKKIQQKSTKFEQEENEIYNL